MQCCTFSKWIHLRCLLLSFSIFRTLDSSHSYISSQLCFCFFLEIPHQPALCLPFRVSPACTTPLFNLAYLAPLLMKHSRHTLAFKPPSLLLLTSYLLPLHPPYPFMFLAIFLYLVLPLPLPDSLKTLQWNGRRFRARSTELLHFILSHPGDPICIQESNLNSSSSFRIPGFSVLQSDRTLSPSGIFSPGDPHACVGVISLVSQSLSFSELSTFSVSLLDPYSDCVGVIISLNNIPLALFPECL